MRGIRPSRNQLTVIGQFAQAIVASEINGNSFAIKTDKPTVKVSWQVTGIRRDPYAVAHPMTVEVEKLGIERGKYLAAKEYGQPEMNGLDVALRHIKAPPAGEPATASEPKP